MSALDPLGGNRFWFNGTPFPGISISSRGLGAQKYCFNGLPVATLFPVTFVPPPNPGNSGNGKKGGPGQTKKQEMILAGIVHRRKRRKRHAFETDATSFIPAQYLSPGARSSLRGIDGIDVRKSVRRISISPAGHTVRDH